MVHINEIEEPDGASLERKRQKELKRKLRTFNESTDVAEGENLTRRTQETMQPVHAEYTSSQLHQNYASVTADDMQLDSDVMFASEVTAERSGLGTVRVRRSTLTESKVGIYYYFCNSYFCLEPRIKLELH